jgi:hypothetical protein
MRSTARGSLFELWDSAPAERILTSKVALEAERKWNSMRRI